MILSDFADIAQVFTAVAALCVAWLAFEVSAKQAETDKKLLLLSQKHNKLSVRPIIDSMVTDVDEIKWILINNGLGPGILKKVEIMSKNERICDYKKFFQQRLSDQKESYRVNWHCTTFKDRHVLDKQGEFSIFNVTKVVGSSFSMKDFLHELEVVVEYEDIYGESMSYRSNAIEESW